ncbi:hypothetical protein FRX31_025428 [Thalictrum thalictroides]|uniref:F-box associated beta-propeller type 3 domain-containing protein n=1 Tax=Thalictrum thalictroides TaxID=46969 RepID=A0A7J6VIP3_THATH|nr:hypothetical protein FRX31_025428 [Thalictrum thalictroides]
MSNSKDDKEEEMVSMSYFNDDIVFNIFTKLPGEILQKKIKYQCRNWFNLVSNPVFAETHLYQAKDGILLTVIPKYDKLVFMDLKGLEANKLREIKLFSTNFIVRGVCNGLLLLEVHDGYEHKLYVTNPFTKKTMLLPKCIHDHHHLYVLTTELRWDLVYVPSTKAYKLVELLYDGKLQSYLIRTQTLSSTSSNESWQPIKELGKLAFTYYDRISVNGILYMHYGYSRSWNPIVSFDVGDEKTIRLLPLPKDYGLEWLIKMDGFLSLIGTKKWPYFDFDVWILKNDDEWVKKLSFCVPQEICKGNYYDKKVLGSLNNGEVILFEDGIQRSRVLIFYVKTKLWKAVDIFKPKKRIEEDRFKLIYGTEIIDGDIFKLEEIHETERIEGVAKFLKGTHVNSIVSLAGFK